MERISIGRVIATRGTRGEVRVAPAARDPGRFQALEHVFVDGIDGPEDGFEVLSAWEHRGGVVLELAGIDDPESAAALVGHELSVPAEDAVELEADENFVHDLVGLAVVTDTGREVGVLEQVLEGPANDIYQIRGPFGELLVPAIGSIVLSVDLQQRRMVIHDLPGLLEPESPL